jgi:transcriptional accessory protein Tex/SPT6
LSVAFDKQKQKLQVLELNRSADTLEFLKSTRHDLINDLEKPKTKLNELCGKTIQQFNFKKSKRNTPIY